MVRCERRHVVATNLSGLDFASRLDERITGRGWRRSESRGDYFRWEKTVTTGTARLVLNGNMKPSPDSARPWSLIATAPPAGRRVTGC